MKLKDTATVSEIIYWFIIRVTWLKTVLNNKSINSLLHFESDIYALQNLIDIGYAFFLLHLQSCLKWLIPTKIII